MKRTLLSPSKWSFWAGLSTIVVVAAVGVVVLVYTHAAGTFVATEAETGILAGGAGVQNDSAASGGKAVQFTAASPSPVACAISGATGAPGGQTYAVPAPTSSDQTAAIQNQINAASAAGGGVVQLAAGTYTINGHLVVKNNVDLNGAGMFSTVIKAGTGFMAGSHDGGYPVLAVDDAINVTISNLEADQSGDTLYQAGLVSESTPGRLTAYLVDVLDSANVIVEHVATRNPFTYSLVANNSTKFCFRNDNVEQSASENGYYDQLDGIHVLDSTYGDVLNNWVDQRAGGATDGDDGLVAHAISYATHDIAYSGNVVRGGANGNDLQIAPGPAIYNVQITGNEFYGGPFGIRTGVYGAGANTVDHLTITGNNIHNNTAGNVYTAGGESVDIGGPETGGGLGGATNVAIQNNRSCSADGGADGPFFAIAGAGNVLSGNTTYTGCTDAPATANPAPN